MEGCRPHDPILEPDATAAPVPGPQEGPVHNGHFGKNARRWDQTSCQNSQAHRARPRQVQIASVFRLAPPYRAGLGLGFADGWSTMDLRRRGWLAKNLKDDSFFDEFLLPCPLKANRAKER